MKNVYMHIVSNSTGNYWEFDNDDLTMKSFSKVPLNTSKTNQPNLMFKK